MELNDYSFRFLAVVLRAFPAFGERVAAGPDAGCFTVEFPAPSGSTFWVATEDFDRITVGFDAHHVHFGGWAESVDAQDFDNAVEYIRQIMHGEYLVAVWSRDGAFTGSVTFARGETPQPWGSGEGLAFAVKGWQSAEQRHAEPGAAAARAAKPARAAERGRSAEARRMTIAGVLSDARFLWDRQPSPPPEVWVSFVAALPPDAPASYREFMRLCDGGCGNIPHASRFLSLWRAGEAAGLQAGYGFPQWLSGFLGFGSDGAGLLFCFDLRGSGEPPVCTVSATCMEMADVRVVAPSFLRLLRDTLEGCDAEPGAAADGGGR